MCIEAVRKVAEENQQLDLGVPIECVLEALEITICHLIMGNLRTISSLRLMGQLWEDRNRQA